MRLAIVSDSLINEKLSMPLYNSNGSLFMNSGINLTKEAISYIQKLGINNVYIDDGNNDIVLQEILDTPIRINLSQTLNKEFNNIKKTKHINEEAILTISNIIINNLNNVENIFFLN